MIHNNKQTLKPYKPTNLHTQSEFPLNFSDMLFIFLWLCLRIVSHQIQEMVLDHAKGPI